MCLTVQDQSVDSALIRLPTAFLLLFMSGQPLVFSTDICSPSTHFREHTAVFVLSAAFPSSDYFGAKLLGWVLFE